MAKEQIAKGVDLVWDSWVNSLKTIEKVQEDFEKELCKHSMCRKNSLNLR